MKFKIDENCTFEVARLLNEHGFDSHTVHDEKIVGSTDDKIYDICIKEKRTLITLDLDFADMRRYPPKSGTGIIVLRLHKQDSKSVSAIIKKIIPQLKKEPMGPRLWIVEEDRIRIRD